MSLVEIGDRNCPRCGKRMMTEIDQNELGRVRTIHECWHCDFREIELGRPRLTVVQGGQSGAERLKRVRLGGGEAS